jgi:EpsI family protein
MNTSQTVTKVVILGCAILGLQALVAAEWSLHEYLPAPPPLSTLPTKIGLWHADGDRTVDREALDMLSPDDIVDRLYSADASASGVDLLVVYYKSQHRAKEAHDPKVCLPGSGWIPVESTRVQIPTQENNPAIFANHYVIQKGASRATVIYWFQTVNGTVAEMEGLRLSKLFHSIRSNRSDMALVRVIVVQDPLDRGEADARATAFARALYPALARYFPVG